MSDRYLLAWCQKCGTEQPADEVRRCEHCQLKACGNCRAPLKTIRSADLCCECEAIRNTNEAIAMLSRRRAKP